MDCDCKKVEKKDNSTSTDNINDDYISSAYNLDVFKNDFSVKDTDKSKELNDSSRKVFLENYKKVPDQINSIPVINWSYIEKILNDKK